VVIDTFVLLGKRMLKVSVKIEKGTIPQGFAGSVGTRGVPSMATVTDKSAFVIFGEQPCT
jgi:hypothetical protein